MLRASSMCKGKVVISVNLVPSDPRHQFENPMSMHVTIQVALKGGLCGVIPDISDHFLAGSDV